MKHLPYIFSTIILIILLICVTTNAQETTPTPLPTLSQLRPEWSAFPSDLFCEYVDNVSEGPTWGDVTIGISSAEDLKNYADTIANYDFIEQYADFMYLARTGELQDESGIPPVIKACINFETQLVTALEISLNTMSIEDLIAEYGIPDVVTWGSNNISRTVFWFDEGIAISVYILEESEILDYGVIGSIVYFPYQTVEGFEERWPYNRTNSENPVYSGRVYDPAPSEEQNPFDFEVMIATITAQPSRTPTPTFAPPSSTPTATPRP